MACLTCLRRNKECDDRRPRCSPCKISHLRCAYYRPPGVFTFCTEYSGSVRQRGGRRSRERPILPVQLKEATWQNVSSRFVVDIDPEYDPGLPHSISRDSVASQPFETMGQETQQQLIGPDGLQGNYHSFRYDDFYQEFNLEGTPYLDFSFNHVMPETHHHDLVDHSSSTDTPGNSIGSLSTIHDSTGEPPREINKPGSLPAHVLAQHYSTKLTNKYSFKSADWTFYTYFFHRFTQSHPGVLSSIQAWAGTNLFYSGKADSLVASLHDYADCVLYMKEKYGINHDDFEDPLPSTHDSAGDMQLVDASEDDIDAIFIGHFFLALSDLMSARAHQLRKVLRFVAHILQTSEVKQSMGGVRSRVASWFCILDCKASAFQLGDGAVMDAIGGEDGLIAALDASYLTLQHAYSLTYPDEVRKEDEEQLPLLRRMLSLASLLNEITRLKHRGQDAAELSRLRGRLDTHQDFFQISEFKSFNDRSRIRSTFLVLCALYNCVEISFSRNLQQDKPRYSASGFARKVIQLTQQLNELHAAKFGTSPDTPPPTKLWPLPLVMAAIEVDDTIYRAWAIDRLKAYEKIGGDHYAYTAKFVEAVCTREDSAATRLDWEPILIEVRDGLVI